MIPPSQVCEIAYQCCSNRFDIIYKPMPKEKRRGRIFSGFSTFLGVAQETVQGAKPRRERGKPAIVK
jgi:hypothetical protein